MEAWVHRGWEDWREQLAHIESVLPAIPRTLSNAARTLLSASSATVLLVEDEAFVREATSGVLESAGCRVFKARNALEATTLFKQYKKIVTLLLTDVVLPGENGHDLARKLTLIQPALRTIFISGYPENAVTKNGAQENGVFYLPKPFSAGSLIEKVHQALGEVPSSGRGAHDGYPS